MGPKSSKEELQKDIEEVSNNYKRDARGEKKGELITEFMNMLMPMVFNMKADNTEEMERLRKA